MKNRNVFDRDAFEKGHQIRKALMLEKDSDGLVDTIYGKKSPTGLYRTIVSIIEGEI